MGLAVEFMYTGKCSFTHDNYFEMLLLANMIELRELEKALLDHLFSMHYDEQDFKDGDGNKTHRAKMKYAVLDFYSEGRWNL